MLLTRNRYYCLLLAYAWLNPISARPVERKDRNWATDRIRRSINFYLDKSFGYDWKWATVLPIGSLANIVRDSGIVSDEKLTQRILRRPIDGGRPNAYFRRPINGKLSEGHSSLAAQLCTRYDVLNAFSVREIFRKSSFYIHNRSCQIFSDHFVGTFSCLADVCSLPHGLRKVVCDTEVSEPVEVKPGSYRCHPFRLFYNDFAGVIGYLSLRPNTASLAVSRYYNNAISLKYDGGGAPNRRRNQSKSNKEPQYIRINGGIFDSTIDLQTGDETLPLAVYDIDVSFNGKTW